MLCCTAGAQVPSWLENWNPTSHLECQNHEKAYLLQSVLSYFTCSTFPSISLNTPRLMGCQITRCHPDAFLTTVSYHELSYPFPPFSLENSPSHKQEKKSKKEQLCFLLMTFTTLPTVGVSTSCFFCVWTSSVSQVSAGHSGLCLPDALLCVCYACIRELSVCCTTYGGAQIVRQAKK